MSNNHDQNPLLALMIPDQPPGFVSQKEASDILKLPEDWISNMTENLGFRFHGNDGQTYYSEIEVRNFRERLNRWKH